MKSQQLLSIGFIGLGNMGGRMAKNLHNAGYPLIGYDIDTAKCDALAAIGVTTGKATLAEKLNISAETVRNRESGRTQPNQKRYCLGKSLRYPARGLALDIKEILSQDLNDAYFGDEATCQRLKWADKNRKLSKFIESL